MLSRIMSSTDLRIRVVPAIRDVPSAAWDACANPPAPARASDGPPLAAAGTTCPATAPSAHAAEAYNPFISHAFLQALEASGSATARTGWQPQHLVAEDEDGAVVGVAPCYLKSHSRGEYVFDRGWAE